MKKERLKILLLEVKCSTRESSKILVREVEQKYVTKVKGENNSKFNYYTECVSGKNIRIQNKNLKRFVAKKFTCSSR